MTASPPPGCSRCPRLVAYRGELRARHPAWCNAPVPGWGDPDAWLLVVGLAPGAAGANRTGRPFTGDASGDLLHATLARLGLSNGRYAGHAADGLVLHGVFIANAAACVPPQNRPLPAEIAACRPFLAAGIAALPALRAAVALGRVAHDALLRALGERPSAFPFAHGAVHRTTRLIVHDSYHCSRLNTNTGRLTPAMLEAVFAAALG